MNMMIKAVGSTYKAKNLLKDAGFSWDTDLQAWVGDVDARMEFGRITTATYSRANQKLSMGIDFVEVKK